MITNIREKFHICDIARLEDKENSFLRVEGWKYFRSFHVVNITDSPLHSMSVYGVFRTRLGKIDASGRIRYNKLYDNHYAFNTIWRGWNTPTPSWVGIPNIYIEKGYGVQLSYKDTTVDKFVTLIALRNY